MDSLAKLAKYIQLHGVRVEVERDGLGLHGGAVLIHSPVIDKHGAQTWQNEWIRDLGEARAVLGY